MTSTIDQQASLLLQYRLGLSEKTSNQIIHLCDTYGDDSILDCLITESDYTQWSEDTINNHLAELAEEIGHSEKCGCEICETKKRIESIIQ